MGTLEDQLKQWQKQAKPPASSSSSPKGTAKGTAKASPAAPLSKRAAKKKPLLQTIRRDDPVPTRGEPPPPKPLSDADLFAAAIEGVSADAVLDKFAAAPTVKVRGQTLQPSAPKTEAELFADFVGTVQPKGAPSPPKKTKPR